MVSCLVFNFAQFWNSFGCVFHNTGDLYGINLFLEYSLFKVLTNKSTPFVLFSFRGSFLAGFAQSNDSLDTVWLKTCSRPVFQFGKFWNRFACVFHKAGDLYGIRLFLGCCIFKFLDNTGIALALFAFKEDSLAVFAQSKDSLDKIWFENGLSSRVPICAILK